MEIFNLILIVVLILLTSFFVASEFAIVKVRKSRIDQLVEEGNKSAIAAKKVLINLDGYLSAAQLGITISALGLGWLGEPTIELLLHPLFDKMHLSEAFEKTLSFIIAFSLITFLHVVFGELAPKTIAIQKSEKIALLTARPLIWFYRIMYPLIWALNGSARLIVRMLGLKPASEHEVAHTEEELRLILTESYEKGEINQAEFKYVNNIFQFDERVAKEIMVPRTEIVVINPKKTLTENIELMLNEKYTRYPVIDEDKDHIVGMVNIKEVLTEYVKNNNYLDSIDQFVRPIIRVMENIHIHELLLNMQKCQTHMAILVDEYGGTSGLVTVEDILEEIVGDIRDEFDIDEKPMIQSIGDDKFVFDGKVLISDINELLNLDINDQELDTLGGWILTSKLDISIGDTMDIDNYQFKVISMEGMQIKSIEAKRVSN